MILVRVVFQAKVGHAAELVAGLKQGAEIRRGFDQRECRVRILTDLSGPFDTVIQELEYESLEHAAQAQVAMFADPRLQQLMQSGRARDLVVGGSKDFYTVEYEA